MSKQTKAEKLKDQLTGSRPVINPVNVFEKPETQETIKPASQETEEPAGNPSPVAIGESSLVVPSADDLLERHGDFRKQPIVEESDLLRHLLDLPGKQTRKITTEITLEQELEINKVQMLFKAKTNRKLTTQRIIQEALDRFLPSLKDDLKKTIDQDRIDLTL